MWCENDFGRFAVVLVGALNVSSISLAWAGEVPSTPGIVRSGPPVPALTLPAGGWLGQFNLGSTVVIVAERGLVRWDDGLHVGAAVRMGNRLGSWPARG